MTHPYLDLQTRVWCFFAFKIYVSPSETGGSCQFRMKSRVLLVRLASASVAPLDVKVWFFNHFSMHFS